MDTILIGDIGSTKAQWAVLSPNPSLTFETSGYNPVQHEDSAFVSMLKSVVAQCPEQITTIFYYGTGIISDETRKRVEQGCREVFGKTDIVCESDMLGAARGLSAGKESIVCILGTGSNSCLFDGKSITQQIPSLGFPLGDEGSGADLGKACVRAFYYGLMPGEMHKAFGEVLPSDRSDFLRQYRSHPMPNRWLAELVPLVFAHRETLFIQNIIEERFRTFARLHITPYDVACPVHFTGGVAYAFRNVLQDTLSKEQFISGIIAKSPLEGLIAYHQYNQSHG